MRWSVYAWFLVCVLCAGAAEATPFTLSWNPNAESDLAGYILSYGIVSGQYSSTVDVGNTTSYIFSPPDPTRVYFLAVQAYSTASLISGYSNEVSTTPVPPPLTLTSISSNLTSPQPLGTTMTLSATATGGVTPYQFKWWVDNGAVSSVGQDWSTSSSFAWTPTVASSNYSITAWARNAGSTADAPDSPAASLSAPFSITAIAPQPPPPLTLTSISSSLTSPQLLGTTITLSVTATGGVTPYQFKWWVADGGVSSVGQNWSTSNSFAWTPTVASSNYSITAWARNAGSTADAPDSAAATLSAPFSITAPAPPPPPPPPPPPAITVTLTANKTPPVRTGRAVTFTAVASGGTQSYQYEWRVSDGTTWTVGQSWSSLNTFIWRTRIANPNYVVEVWVRDATSQLDQPAASSDMAFPIVSR